MKLIVVTPLVFWWCNPLSVVINQLNRLVLFKCLWYSRVYEFDLPFSWPASGNATKAIKKNRYHKREISIALEIFKIMRVCGD